MCILTGCLVLEGGGVRGLSNPLPEFLSAFVVPFLNL
jgi:hypothetical protein